MPSRISAFSACLSTSLAECPWKTSNVFQATEWLSIVRPWLTLRCHAGVVVHAILGIRPSVKTWGQGWFLRDGMEEHREGSGSDTKLSKSKRLVSAAFDVSTGCYCVWYRSILIAGRYDHLLCRPQ